MSSRAARPLAREVDLTTFGRATGRDIAVQAQYVTDRAELRASHAAIEQKYD